MTELIRFVPLSYQERLQTRQLDAIELAVVHATELPDLATARRYGERVRYPRSGTGNSGHYYIDRDGTVEQWVALDRIAHHVAGHNDQSIGIELVNRGRWPNWHDSRHQHWPEPSSEAQIEALIALLNELDQQLPELRHMAGHDHLDRREVAASDDPALRVRRKLDPGPDFPWARVIEQTRLKPLP